MEAANCISCGAEIFVRQPVKIGSQLKCNNCDAELEIVWLDPLEVDWPFLEDDDYDDDEEEEEYYYEDQEG